MQSTLTSRSRSTMIAVLATAMVCSAPVARAELVATQQLASPAQTTQPAASSTRNPGTSRQTLNRFIARADVQRKLESMGLSRDVTEQRLAALSDSEVADLATRIDRLPAAGHIGFQELVIILLVAILVVVAV